MPESVPKTAFLQTVRQGLEKRKASIEQMLPRGQSTERFLNLAWEAVREQPWLSECTALSVIGSIVDVSKLGLSLDRTLGQAYLVPFKDKRGVKRATFIPGYRGLIVLAYRSPKVRRIWSGLVRRGDFCSFDGGSDYRLIHRPRPMEEHTSEYLSNDSIIGVYACCDVGASSPVVEPMPIAEVKDIQARSKAGRDGPWITDFAQMARKTALRRLCKYLPLTPEAQSVVGRDELFDAGVTPEPTEVEYDEIQREEGGLLQALDTTTKPEA